jgi:hypothetical protein
MAQSEDGLLREQHLNGMLERASAVWNHSGASAGGPPGSLPYAQTVNQALQDWITLLSVWDNRSGVVDLLSGTHLQAREDVLDKLAPRLGDAIGVAQGTKPSSIVGEQVLKPLCQLGMTLCEVYKASADDLDAPPGFVGTDPPYDLFSLLNSFSRGYMEADRTAATEERLIAERDNQRRIESERQAKLTAAKQTDAAVGDISLAAHYETYASKERRSADLLRFVVFAFVVVATAVAVAFSVSTFNGVGPDAVDLIGHLGVAALLTGAASYAARESSRHRAAAARADGLAVQLQTLDAFIRPLDAQQGNELRTDLGRRLFGDPPAAAEAAGDSGAVTIPQSLLDAVVKLIERR